MDKLLFLQHSDCVAFTWSFLCSMSCVSITVDVIEHKKPSAKPIVDPVAFLFGCLKKMEINPPPGWKSRAVRMMEDEERRLKEEAEELRAVGSRVERQGVSCTFYAWVQSSSPTSCERRTWEGRGEEWFHDSIGETRTAISGTDS